MNMKRKLAKVLALAMTACTLGSATGCFLLPQETLEPGTIYISLWDSGWGSDWLDEMAKEFSKEYPQYTVKYEASTAEGDITNLLPNPDQHQYDIIMGCNTNPTLYDAYYEKLDDVVNSRYKNESKTIGEKIGPELLSMLVNADGHYDKLCFGAGYYNIIYKTDIYENYEYEVPNTTDEFVTLVNQMRGDDVVPFIHFVNGGYWHSMLWTWAIQYAGMKDFYSMSQNPTLAALVSDENGIPQGLDVLYALLGDINNYYTGSSGLDFTDAQSQFLAPAEKVGAEIAMMVNGGWMENELKNSEDKLNENVSVMKTPVVSSIINKCPTINDDETLSAVIDAIDKNKTSYEGVSAADFELIRTARKVEVSNAPGLEICIPNYCDEKEGAKEFVKFFYSDKGLKIWFDKTHVKQFADFDDSSIKLSTTGLSEFEKSQLELAKKSTPVAEGRPHSSHILFVKGGASLVAGYDNAGYVANMVKQPPENSKTIWANIKAKLNKDWTTYWKNAGLTAPEEE